MAFSKFKALLKKAAARTIDDLWTAIAQALPQLAIGRPRVPPFSLAGFALGVRGRRSRGRHR